MYAMEDVFGGYEKRKAELERSRNPLSKGVALIDGAFVPIAEARIPLLDQGFLRSDLTYDVPAVWDGRYFRLDDHLDRLEASCAKMRFRMPLERGELRNALIDMVARSAMRDVFVEIIVTRGLKNVREYKTSPSNIYLFALPYIWAMQPAIQRAGGSAVVARTVRRIPPGAIDPTVKNLQWGDFVRGVLEAMDRDATFPILTDGDGNITEGAGYNIFLIKDGVLKTPERGVLEGVTRRTVFDIAKAKGWRTAVEHVPVDALYSCDELFFCTTAGGIMPVTTLDGERVGGGQIGPITRTLWEAYWEAHYDPKLSFAIKYS